MKNRKQRDGKLGAPASHGAPATPPSHSPAGDDGEGSPEALWRVFQKLQSMSSALGEIDDYFDSRPAWLSTMGQGSCPAPALPAASLVTLENLDAHILREGVRNPPSMSAERKKE
jgi:hypothetical protein